MKATNSSNSTHTFLTQSSLLSSSSFRTSRIRPGSDLEVPDARCGYGQVNPDAALAASAAAAEAVSSMIANSLMMSGEDKKSSVALFEKHEVVTGALLGKGGFSNVYEIQSFNLTPDDGGQCCEVSTLSEQQSGHRKFLLENCLRSSDSHEEPRYAIKFLRLEVMASDPSRFVMAAKDIAVEAKFLMHFDHPNIIRLRGMSVGGTRGIASALEGGYFLVLDRLYHTLGQQISRWKVESKSIGNRGFISKRLKYRSGARRKDFLAKRLQVAFDLSGALKYLHERNIVYRDLKPDNVGFDVRGDVKLFDFGLAKELRDNDKNDANDECYRMSGCTGSLRYMAPEVAQFRPYNLAVDIYSFGILLWEILSLKIPYEGFSPRKHSDKVVYGKTRPLIDKSWPSLIRSLLRQSWAEYPSHRPSMDCVYGNLRKELAALKGEDNEALLDHSRRRRSTHIFEGNLSL